MNRSYRLSTALDVDDLLLECVPHAIRLANEKYKFDPPLSIHEVDHWGKLGTRADVIFEFMDDPDFFRTQPVIPGAKEFVRKLSQMTEVFISTAVWPNYMTTRFHRILEEFPEIPQDHILMGARKDKIDVDILFDDGMHNVFRSNASYPILMRRPWNWEATGVLAVNTYDEFLKLVEVIAGSFSIRREPAFLTEPSVVVLVGPSGSGKNELAQGLLQRSSSFEKLVSYTTDETILSRNDPNYLYVNVASFRKMRERGEIFESTTYGNHDYGSCKADVEKILAKGKHVLTVMDICGAMAMKTHFPNVTTIYVKRDKKQLLTSILEKDAPVPDKVNRLLAIESEAKNAQICDYTIKFDDCASAVSQICQTLGV